MTYPIANKVVLITGATGGIGTATAKAQHARGARVVLTDLRQETVDARFPVRRKRIFCGWQNVARLRRWPVSAARSAHVWR